MVILIDELPDASWRSNHEKDEESRKTRPKEQTLLLFISAHRGFFCRFFRVVSSLSWLQTLVSADRERPPAHSTLERSAVPCHSAGLISAKSMLLRLSTRRRPCDRSCLSCPAWAFGCTVTASSFCSRVSPRWAFRSGARGVRKSIRTRFTSLPPGCFWAARSVHAGFMSCFTPRPCTALSTSSGAGRGATSSTAASWAVSPGRCSTGCGGRFHSGP